MRFLGPGMRVADLTLSRTELEALKRIYGYVEEPPQERPPPPVFVEPAADAWPSDRRRAEEAYQMAMKDWESWTSAHPLTQAGADRNCVREAKTDGLRLMAWLAKFVPAGTDPLKTLIQIVSQVGWDVESEDLAWADPDPGEQELGAVGE